MYNNGICAVCNGFESLQAACPLCGSAAEDCGRVSDYYGPYSPYRPIDDLRLTNGALDLAVHECPHEAYCERCGTAFVTTVKERDVP